MSADFSFMEEDNIPELPPPINIDLQQITSSESAVPSLSSTRAGSRPIDVDSSRGLTSTFAQRFGQGAQGSQFEDPFAPGAAGAKKAVKKPRFVKKLDANLLLSDDALPRLLRSSKKLKFKGKGHESEDLEKLILFYQVWIHEFYPSLSLESGIEKIEKLCREKRLRVFLQTAISEERRRRLGFTDELTRDEELPDEAKTTENPATAAEPLTHDVAPLVDGSPSNDGSSATAEAKNTEDGRLALLTGSTLSAEQIAKIQANRQLALARFAEKQRARELEKQKLSADNVTSDNPV